MEHLGLDVALFRFFLVAWPRKGRVSEHDGWGQVTKFVQIKMKDRWGQHGQHGQHVNHLGVFIAVHRRLERE